MFTSLACSQQEISMADLSATAASLLAAGVPTPFYLYDLATVRKQAVELRAAMQGAELLYAMKANSNAHVLATVLAAVDGAECVSPGEVALATELGALRVLFTPSSASESELATAAAAPTVPPLVVTCDSLSAIARLPRGARACLRLNCGVGGGHHAHVVTAGSSTKFGIACPRDLQAALEVASAGGVTIVGLHQHLGSGVLDADVFLAAAEGLFAAAESNAAALPDLEFIDAGGGLGVPYRPSESPLDIVDLGVRLLARFARTRAALPSHPRLVLEPGRFFVAQAGALVATVTSIKVGSDGVRRAGIDTGFNHLARPMVYGAWHDIVRVAGGSAVAAAAAVSVPTLVVGNVCESGDVFTPEGPRSMALAEGDAVALLAAGAYGYAMSSDYNLRPRPAEYIVDDAAAVAAWVSGGGAGGAGGAAAECLRRPGPAISLPDGRAAICSTRAQTQADLVRAVAHGGF